MIEPAGIEISGGLGPLAGKVFPSGIMRPLATEPKVEFLLPEFAEALAAEGYRA